MTLNVSLKVLQINHICVKEKERRQRNFRPDWPDPTEHSIWCLCHKGAVSLHWFNCHMPVNYSSWCRAIFDAFFSDACERGFLLNELSRSYLINGETRCICCSTICSSRALKLYIFFSIIVSKQLSHSVDKEVCGIFYIFDLLFSNLFICAVLIQKKTTCTYKF